MITDLIQGAFRHILRDKFRSALTVLSLLIGIAAIVIISSLNEGSKVQIAKMIQVEGQNLLIIKKNDAVALNYTADTSTSPSLNSKKLDYAGLLTPYQAQTIRTLFPEISYASPEESSTEKISLKSSMVEAQIIGVWSDYFSIRNLQLIEGRCFSKLEERLDGEPVCIVAMSRDMLGFLNGNKILGEKIFIQNVYFRVIGIVEYKHYSAANQPYVIYTPFNSLTQWSIPPIKTFIVKVSNEKNLKKIQTILPLVLKRFFVLTEYKVENPADTFISDKGILGMIALILGGIASISLIVGGIGIMNIMIVSVMERKKEIGIKKAIGADESDIVLEFMVETILICVIGGVLGVAVGFFGAYIVSTMIQIPLVIPLIPAATGLFFSVLIAFVSGIYPAIRASRLDPIDCLGYS